MLIIPLQKKPTRRNFPYITAVLIVLNSLVFAVLQNGDRETEMQALQLYLDSGLSTQEWRWYGDYLDAEDVAYRAKQREVNTLADNDAVPELTIAALRAHEVERHPDFLRALRAGEILPRDTADWQTWAERRDEYESILSESFTRSHLLSAEHVTPARLIGHMFMHGGVMHLVGNLVFLALLGLLVERAMRGPVYLAVYLLCGLAAGMTFVATHLQDGQSVLGASGAIAGLMGLFTVIYGLRRVRFFYWFFVYFDYVRAPAILLLPAWLGWEVLQFFIGSEGIAYEAHAGGIVAGALAGLAIRQFGWLDTAFLNEECQREEDRDALRRARADITALRPAMARARLEPLLERHPHDPDVLRAWFSASMIRRDDPARHEALARVLALSGDTADERRLIQETLAAFRPHGELRIDSENGLELARRLIRWEAFDLAEWLLGQLERRSPPGQLADAWTALGQALLARRETQRGRDCLAAAGRFTPEEDRQESSRGA